MGSINYKFENFDKAFAKLRNGDTDKAVKDIKFELNKFFKDSRCIDVMYTNNIDKPFFGMTTYCIMKNDEIDKVINSDEPIRITEYFIEIDSKLLTDVGLSSRELTAVLLHEVGHLVNDSTPIEDVRKAMDAYMAEFGTNMDIVASRDYNALFKFAVQDSIRKSRSMFTRRDQEVLADEFVFRCGYGHELEKAFRNIVAATPSLSKGIDNKFIALQWTLRIYKDLKINRLGAIKVLNRIADLSGSELEKKEIKNTVRQLKTCNTNGINESATIIEESDKTNPGLVARIRRNGLKSIEEDLFEYQMRIRNVESEDDAIVLMRQLNTRMSVLDDYLCYGEGTEQDRKRWEKVYYKYDLLREELSKKTVYNRKNYGLWLDYNYAPAQLYTPQNPAY